MRAIRHGFSDDDRAKMAAMYADGMTQREIARQFGCSQTTCRIALSKLGVAPRGIVSATKKAEIVALYQSGKSLHDLNRMTGCTRATCRRFLVEAGLDIRHPTTPRKYTLDERYFEHITDESRAYWLGFLAADGCVNGGKNALVVALAWKDAGHLAKFLKAMGSDQPVKRYEARVRGETHAIGNIGFTSKPLLRDLAQHGVTERKSHTIKPWNGPRHLLRHYWRGVVDGDGSIFKDKRGGWGFTVIGSVFMIDSLREYMRSELGDGGRLEHKGKCDIVSYRAKPTIKMIVSHLYADSSVFLDRKRDKVSELLGEMT